MLPGCPYAKTGGLALSKEKNLSPGGGCSDRLQKNSVSRKLTDPHFFFNTIPAPYISESPSVEANNLGTHIIL